RVVLRAHRHRRRRDARLRPRARRDDGRDNGDRQQPEGDGVALRAAIHDGGRHRERIHRGGRSALCQRVDRNRPRPVRDHPRDQRAVAATHRGDDEREPPGSGARRRRCRGDRRMTRVARRKALSSLFVGFCALSVLIALVPLAFVLFYVVSRGIAALNFAFFTQMPKPVGEVGGGMANAIVGTLILVGLAAGLAVTVGIISGVYMSEYAGSRFATAIRFAADTLNGVPSIVIGVFAYGIAVLPFKQFSAIAGGLALGIMMIPIMARTTEELLLLVPSTMREGALALGATRARAVFTVVLPAALPGVVTGAMLALARIAGETAPLLFTSFNNRFFTTKLTQPISSLTVQVFTYAISPYEDWHRQAWAGALTLVGMVLICSVLARIATRRLERMHVR